MKRHPVLRIGQRLVVIAALCVLATVPGMTGVVACWVLAVFACRAYYRFCRATGHTPRARARGRRWIVWWW